MTSNSTWCDLLCRYPQTWTAVAARVEMFDRLPGTLTMFDDHLLESLSKTLLRPAFEPVDKLSGRWVEFDKAIDRRRQPLFSE